MTKAVGYVGADGGSGQDAPDAQRGRIWAWCKDQGMPLDDIHAESTPFDPERPALQAALVAASGGVLVVDVLADLAFTVPELAAVVGRMHDAGTRLVALSDGLDTASDPEAMAVRMLTAAARLAGPVPSGGPFAFADPAEAEVDTAAPQAPDPAMTPAAPPDEAAIATLLGTVLAPPPDPLDADAPVGPEPSDAAPAWGDLPLDGGVGGFADAAPEPDAVDASDSEDAQGAQDVQVAEDTAFAPDVMQNPLAQLQDAVESAADVVAGMAGEDGELPAEDGAPPVHRALRSVSPIQDDVVPVNEAADPAEHAAPLPPFSGPDPDLPTYGNPHARARHRRESDYAATAEKASRQLQKGRLDKAAAIWTEFLKGAGGNNAGRGWNHLGDIHARARRTVEAADAWLNAARAFETAHYNHMAVATLKKVIKLDPGRPEVHRALAELNARCDRVGDAVESYLRYARFLKDDNRLAEALEMFCRIRILDPVNARHRMQLADELFAFGFEGEAAREAVHAADLLLERGDHAGAEEHLARWAERIPGHAGLALRLTAMSGGGTVFTREPPAAGIEGGVLLTSGGAGRSRSDDPGWRREPPG